MDIDQAILNQVANIEKKTGKSLDELKALIANCGKTKHGEIRDFLKAELGLGHGDANTLTHVALKTHGSALAEGKSDDAILDEIYTGPKASMRSIHVAIMEKVEELGEHEVAPKKGYVSLRRKKQFAMLGPATNTRFELGLNMKGAAGTDRLKEQPAGGMCTHKVVVGSPEEVDSELVGWIQQAFELSG